jgi:dTDP-4-dehydrorhamnose reductase
VRILLFGETGQLGRELHRTLAPLGEVRALDYPEVDLRNADALRASLRELAADIVINAAAYADVDGAEVERERAFAVNAKAPGIMAEEAKATGALLIHYSTDYVFDGAKGTPYVEEDTPHPLNAYGESKLAGEEAVEGAGGNWVILRTAWLYSMRGNSFVTKVLSWARKQEVLRIVDDQIANPTWARTLAQLTTQVVSRGTGYVQDRKGLYHLGGGGFASRYDWAKEILRLDPEAKKQKVRVLQRAATSEFPTPARRPLFSALDCQRWTAVFGLEVPAWADELKEAMRTTAQNAASR